jgi:ERCC4-related helicase
VKKLIQREQQSIIPTTGVLHDDDFSINSAMMEEFKCQQQETSNLQVELASAKEHITSLLEQMNKDSLNHANQTKSLIHENTQLNEDATRARLSKEQHNEAMETRLRQHGDAIARLMRLPTSYPASNTQGITSPIKNIGHL